MSFLGRVITLFTPLVYVLLVAGGAYWISKSWVLFLIWIFFVAYIFPLISFRIHNLFFPLVSGRTYFDEPQYVSWWGSYQFQRIYYDLPFLEAMLRSCFLYSFWLRAWGSKIGKNVHFTPNIDILDRSLVDIGDNVVLGHKVVIGGHLIFPLNGRQCLFVGTSVIGKNSFIGYGSGIGPNCVVSEGSVLKGETYLTLNQVFKHEK